MEDNKIVIYQTEDGQTQIDVRLENETVWLNVAQMSTLFSKEESNVRRHIIMLSRKVNLNAIIITCIFCTLMVSRNLCLFIVWMSSFPLAIASKASVVPLSVSGLVMF